MQKVIIGDCVLYQGDSLAIIPELASEGIDSVITDPPYELGFMGKSWDATGIAYRVDLWQAVMEVCLPGAHLLSFGGSRTYHRMACAIEDAGWEIRDQILWIYGSGFPKSADVSKAIDKAAGAEREVVGTIYAGIGRQCRSGGEIVGGKSSEDKKYLPLTTPATDAARTWNGYGSALKPAHEPIVLARKPIEGTIAGNCLEHGCGGLNIDGCRVGTEDSLGRPQGTMPHPMDWGNKSTQEVFITNGHTSGRFPANLIHDGSEEVLAGFPNSDHARGNVAPTKSGIGIFNDRPSRQEAFAGDTGSAARFFYCAKASKSERGDGNNHPTVKPLALMEYLSKLTRPPHGGKVLDCFLGSGTTAKAAIRTGRKFIGIEKDPAYFDIACKRIEKEYQEQQHTLFQTA